MKRNSESYKKLRKYHKWFSIVLSLFILVFAFSGMVLNHRELLSSLDVNRNLLPEDYRYSNWNLAAVRGSIHLQDETSLVYGNIGVWITKDDFRTFEDFNQGFPDGIDNRKISKIIRTPENRLFAGTFFGLFFWDKESNYWRKLDLPGNESRIVDLLINGDELWILTRSFLLKADYTKSHFRAAIHTLPPPENYKNKEGLFKTLWVIHSGEIYGLPGKIFVDLMALVFIFLTVTGLMLWLFPGLIKRMKRKGKQVKGWSSSMRFSLKWHNKLGYYLVPFLMLTTITGMFLRPPLLIPIANVKVGKIPFTELDSPNPWFDKLRAVLIDPETGWIVLNTSE
ncbi:MAG: PepSY domain-containing protein, partial [Bacteroidales bacterium]|nr:PepSY domain-containing protein [Bacteroidales bacterium]